MPVCKKMLYLPYWFVSKIKKVMKRNNYLWLLLFCASLFASCGEVKVENAASSQSGGENTFECVDLGLSVKWATCNLGATTPEQTGNFYAFGELEPKKEYSWKNYKWAEGSSITRTKYNKSENYGKVDDKAKLDAEDDVVRVTLGGDWHTPTLAEMAELMDSTKCTWTWTKRNGVDGYEVKSKINGNSIFLPHVGYMSGDILAAYETVYMSSELKPDRRRNTLNAQKPHSGYFGNLVMQSISFYYNGELSKAHLHISCGFPIRPVTTGSCAANSENSNSTKNKSHNKKVQDNASQESSLNKETTQQTEEHSKDTVAETTKELNYVEPDLGTDPYAQENVVVKQQPKQQDSTNRSEFTSEIVLVPESIDTLASAKEDNSYYLGKIKVESVDLGLSVKWATHNVGAASASEVGSFFCWGETAPNNYPSWDTYKWYQSDIKQMTKYCLDEKQSTYDGKYHLEEADDAVRVIWGGKWRTPTPAEWRELMDPNKCEWTWKTVGGLQGYEVKSKNNGNTIFLPAAGYKTGGLTYPKSSGTHYMTTMLSSTNGFSSVTFEMKDGNYNMSQLYRVHGILIRPVIQR